MKVVIDTNIYIAAALGNCLAIDIVNSNDCQNFISNEVFDELIKVIYRKKFKLSDIQRKEFLKSVEINTLLVKVENKVNFNRDREDSKLLELCNEVEAEYLITDDYQLLKGTHLSKTTIISMKVFHEKFIIPICKKTN